MTTPKVPKLSRPRDILAPALAIALAITLTLSGAAAQGLSPSGKPKALLYRGLGPDMTRAEMEQAVYLNRLFGKPDSCATIDAVQACEYVALLLPDHMAANVLVMSDTVSGRSVSVSISVAADGYTVDQARRVLAEDWGQAESTTLPAGTDALLRSGREYVGRWRRAEYEAEVTLRESTRGHRVLLIMLQNLPRWHALFGG